jgi:hypothetical protein
MALGAVCTLWKWVIFSEHFLWFLRSDPSLEIIFFFFSNDLNGLWDPSLINRMVVPVQYLIVPQSVWGNEKRHA